MLLYQIKSEEVKIGKYKDQTMYYAAAVPQDKITTEQVEERIVQATALSRADVRAAITALAQVVREEMFAGRSIDLADLGTFKVVSNGKRVARAEDVTAQTLKTPRIQFYPKNAMRDKAKAVSRQILREGDSLRSAEGGTASTTTTTEDEGRSGI